jgi:hypothetical protein
VCPTQTQARRARAGQQSLPSLLGRCGKICLKPHGDKGAVTGTTIFTAKVHEVHENLLVGARVFSVCSGWQDGHEGADDAPALHLLGHAPQAGECRIPVCSISEEADSYDAPPIRENLHLRIGTDQKCPSAQALQALQHCKTSKRKVDCFASDAVRRQDTHKIGRHIGNWAHPRSQSQPSP